MALDVNYHALQLKPLSIFLTIIFLCKIPVHGITPEDSVEVNFVRNDTWHHLADPFIRYGIDSTIYNLEEYNGVQRPGPEYLHLGNTGSPAYPLIFDPLKYRGFLSGFNQFDAYRYHYDSVRIFKVMRPYSQIQYLIGQRNEQMFNGKFAGQIKQNFQFGVDFTRYNSRGGYVNQNTNVNGFALYATFEPSSANYSLLSVLLLNKPAVSENGGTRVDVFEAGNTFLSKQLAPVWLQKARTSYNELHWINSFYYHLGKKISVKKDTSFIQKKIPTFKAGLLVGIGRDLYRFVDPSPDSIYYGELWQGTDTVLFNLGITKISQALMAEFTGQAAKDGNKIRQYNFRAYMTAQADYHRIREISGKDWFVNVHIRSGIRSNPLVQSRWWYHACVQSYVAGYNKGDLLLDVATGYDIKRWGRLSATFNYHLSESPWVWQSFAGGGLLWSKDFPKQNVLAAGGAYHFLHKIFSINADVKYFFVKNFFYFDSRNQPASDENIASIWVAHAAAKLFIKGFNLHSDIWYQPVLNSTAIRIPQIVSRHSIFYDTRLFKRVLWLSVGFDLRYNSPFFGNEYFPLTGQWILQDRFRLNFYPVLDAFLNFKVRWFRFSAKLENISSLFGPRGYYTAPYYPAADLAFKASVTWRFFE
ncbi:MAG: putative porin [Chitinophagales bacterium]|nr:hypothetical protein [Chitinophagales bacterium]MDW8274247.1 putative porin [Chitinophagales bacterium]